MLSASDNAAWSLRGRVALAADGGEAYGQACDVRDPEQVRDLIAGAVGLLTRNDR